MATEIKNTIKLVSVDCTSVPPPISPAACANLHIMAFSVRTPRVHSSPVGGGRSHPFN